MGEYKTFTEAIQSTTKLNFRKLNDQLLNREFLKKLFPHGIVENNEFCLGDFNGSSGRSLKLNLSSGKWADFASTNSADKGVGVVAFLSRMWNCTIAEAAIRGCEFMGVRIQSDSNEVILPAPECDVMDLPFKGRDRITIERHWKYFDIDGTFLGFAVRFSSETKNEGKIVTPYTYRMAGSDLKGGGWVSKAWGDLYPLYRGEILFTWDEIKEGWKPTEKPVLIVEGEKTADRAQELFPNYDVITWFGGSKKVEKVHWEPLRNRKVIIWPDNDLTGRTAATRIAGQLGSIGVGQVSIVKLGNWADRLPEGWDLADWNEELGMDLRKMMESAEDISTIQQLMNRYIYILQLKRFLDVNNFVKMDREAVDNAHAHVHKKAAQTMLENPDLMKVDAITYWPGMGPIVTDGPRNFTCVNTWREFTVDRCDVSEDELAERVKTFLGHVKYIFPEEENTKFFLDYLAHNIQFPGRKIKFCPIIQGVQGTGKSYFVSLMRRLIGPNFGVATNSDIRQDYNGWVEGRSFLAIEEAMTMGRREVTNALKTLITDDTIRISEKYTVSYDIPNRVNFMILTNYKDGITIDDKERRFWVYFSKAEPKSFKYYDELFEDMNHNYESIHEFLMRRDLSEFKPDGRAPVTNHMKVVSDLTKPNWQIIIDTLVEDEAFPFNHDIFILRSVEEAVEKRKGKIPHMRLLGSYLKEYHKFKDIGKLRVQEGPVKFPMIWAKVDVEDYEKMITTKEGQAELSSKFNQIFNAAGI